MYAFGVQEIMKSEQSMLREIYGQNKQQVLTREEAGQKIHGHWSHLIEHHQKEKLNSSNPHFSRVQRKLRPSPSPMCVSASAAVGAATFQEE